MNQITGRKMIADQKPCCKPTSEEENHFGSTKVLAALAEHRPRFLAYLGKRLRDRALAEDLLQAAYARAVQRAHGLQDPERSIAWFYKILRNTLVDHFRRNPALRLEVPLENPDQFPMQESEDSRPCPCTQREMAALKAEYAQVLRSCVIQEEAVRNYARREGISAGNASVRLHRARTALKARVEHACGECAKRGCLDCSCDGRFHR